VQALLSAIVYARNALQREQTTQRERELIIEFAGLRRVNVAEAIFLVVIIEKCDEEFARLPMRTEHVLLHALSLLEDIDDRLWRVRQTFRHSGQPEEQRKIQRGVDANGIVHRSGITTNKARDLLFIIIHLAKGEEILLADTEGEFPYGVPKEALKVRFDIFEGIDAEAIDVEFRDDVLIGADQDAAHGKVREIW